MSEAPQSRYGTAAQWAALDPRLARGVFAFSTDTGEVRIGNGSDVWSALVPIGGGGGLPTRATVSCSISALAAAGSSEQSLAMAPQFSVLHLNCGAADLRVRLYASAAHRSADASRAVGTDPTGDHGLLLEFVSTAGLTSAWLSPVPVGYLTSGSTAPIRIDNVGASAATATITLTWMELEA